MNKQIKKEVDKEAKKIAQEEISHEIGAIRTQLNEIIDSLQQQPSNPFNPNDLMQEIQRFFEESQRQIREINQKLTDFVQKATPLLNKIVEQSKTSSNINQQNTVMSQPYSQFGGHMQQNNHQMNPMAQQSYGQNQISTQNQFSQNTHQARMNPTFTNVSGQGKMNQTKQLNPNIHTPLTAFNQPNSYGTQTPNYYGIGQMSHQNQTTQNFEHGHFRRS